MVSEEKREKHFLKSCIASIEAQVGEYVFDENDKVFISGVIEEKLEFSHQVMVEKFYKTRVKVIRASGTEDIIPVIISESLIGDKSTIVGKDVEIAGELKTYNKRIKKGKTCLEVFVFARWLEIHDSEDEMKKGKNQIYLNGFVVKPPIYRITPRGREIADVIIGVNNRYGKSSYVPCIIWGRAARYARDRFFIGDNIQLCGRIQSREYWKMEDSDPEKKVCKITYEVSVISLTNVTDEEQQSKKE